MTNLLKASYLILNFFFKFPLNVNLILKFAYFFAFIFYSPCFHKFVGLLIFPSLLFF